MNRRAGGRQREYAAPGDPSARHCAVRRFVVCNGMRASMMGAASFSWAWTGAGRIGENEGGGTTGI
jgi:hypothetical protein